VQRGPFYLERFADLFGKDDIKRLARPTIPVAEKIQIDLGNRILLVNAHKTAHTDNDVSVFDVEANILWAGDLLFHQRIPTLDGSVTGWLTVMDELAQLKPVLVVPGHGSVASLDAIASKQRHYLETMRNEIRAFVAKNGRLSEALDTVGADQQTKWLLFDEMHKGNVTRAFTELEWE